MPTTGGDVRLPALLKTLESPTAGIEEKVEAYKIFSDQVQEDELSFFDLDITYYIEPIVTVLRQDIQHKSESVQQGALQVLGFCLHDLELVRLVPIESQKTLLSSLCKCLKSAEDKSTSTRGLWVISKQNIQPDLVVQELDNIMSSISHSLEKWKGQAQTVEYEAINAISRLNVQAIKEMNAKTNWEKICFSLLTHASSKVREKALTSLEKGCLFVHNKTTMKEIITEFKSKTAGELKKMFLGNEQFVLKVWCFLVKYFGEELHHGGFINIILPIVEIGFKSLEPEVKKSAFQAWKELINNFSTNSSIISDPKRVKLIMQVFKVNNAKVESVALEKFNSWMYYIKKLGTKVSIYFEQVVVPLLKFCTGGNRLASSGSTSTPTTPRFGIKNSGINHLVSPTTLRLSITSTPSQLSTFPSLQLKGVEVLAQIMGKYEADFTTEALSTDIMTSPMYFLKQSTVLVSCFRELVMSLGNQIPERLLLTTWEALIGHVHTAVDITPKSDHRQMFSYFLSQFQFLALVDGISQLLVKMFESICDLPLKVLSSNVYNVGEGELMGTPALFLCEILLSPGLLKSSAHLESYMTIYGKLVNCGMNNTTGTLEFSHGVLDIIDRHAQFIPTIELLWRLWSVIANRLLEHVIKTGEINQGDALEYDFTCLYIAILLPVKHRIGALVSQPVCKSLLKTWLDLYKCFSRQSALVTTAQDNIVCEDFCSKILTNLSTDELKEASMIDYLVQILQVVIDCIDFSSLSGTMAFNLAGNFSPSKRWMKHKQKPLENLHSFVQLYTDLLSYSLDIVENGGNNSVFISKQKSNPSVAVAINGMVDIVTTLVTHISSSNIISNMFSKISEPLSRLFNSSASNKNGTKLHTPAFYQKLEKLWLDISTCLQSRYTSIYDTEFLLKLSPLLEVTFLHSRRSIKNQTILLWNATFSKSSMLTYPDKLQSVLAKVKEKTPITTPGLVTMETTIIDETPATQSQFSQMDAPEAHLPGLPSPHKFRGSFLNKAVSPNIKKSPAKPSTPETKYTTGSAKKKLNIDGITNDVYVVIKPSPKSSRILTEHQKETLKAKKVIPAMYNNLDQSQSLDISMMSQFQSDSHSDSVIEVDPSPTEVIVVPSSQSQCTDEPEDNSMPDSSEIDKQSDSEVEFKQPNTRRRERSVRFSWDEEDKSKDLSQLKSPSSAEEKMEVDDNSKKSETLSSSASSSLKQNVEGALGMVTETLDTVSGKSSSSSPDAKDDKTKDDSPTSQSTVIHSPQSGFVKNRSISQSPKRSTRASPKRNSSSQECRSSSKSPKRVTVTTLSSKFSLDHWLVRSPSKDPVASLKDNVEDPEPNLNILPESLVEDTQSPTKFNNSKESKIENLTQSCTTPSRNLFETPTPGNVSSSPNAVPESPDNLPDAVIKLQKLSDSDIQRYSQELTDSADSEIKFSENKVTSVEASQGFQSNSGAEKLARSDSFGFFTKESSTELDDVVDTASERGISQLLTAEQKDQLDNASTQESYFSAVSQSQSILKANVVDGQKMQSQATYDPTAVNTLKDTLSLDSIKSDESYTNQSQTQKSEYSSQSDSSYDPTKISTLADDSSKSKRKQTTPKKTPTAITPRRTPRRHKKKRHFDCEGTSEEDSELKEEKPLEKIVEESMASPLEEANSVKQESCETSKDKSEKTKITDSQNCKNANDTEKEIDSEDIFTFKGTEDLISERIESQMEATEQTPEGKKPCKEIKRKSTTKEKKAVAKRRSSRMSEEATKSRKQLEESNSTSSTNNRLENKEEALKTVSEEPDAQAPMDCDDTEASIKFTQTKKGQKDKTAEIKDKTNAEETSQPITEEPKRGRSKKSTSDDITDSQQSSQSSQSSTKSSTRKQAKSISSPKTRRLRSSGLVIQTRTLRDGKKITLAKLSPVVKRMRKRERKVRSVSESEAGEIVNIVSDTESELTEVCEINKIVDIDKLDEKSCESKTTDVVHPKNDEVTETDTNNIKSDVFSSLMTSDIIPKDQSKNKTREIESTKTTIVSPNENQNENIPAALTVKETVQDPSKILLESKTNIKEQPDNKLIKDKFFSPQNDQEETPRKFRNFKKRSLSNLMNSDSKVIGLNRFGSRPLMSARGFNIVRRSILQQRTLSDDHNRLSLNKTGSLSPKRSSLLHSPSASPSTGILKRRFSTTDLHANSPSPPSKQRRVSFATPIIAGESPVKISDAQVKPASPLVTNITQITSSRRKEMEDSETQTSQSQPFKCTDEAELSTIGPAFPDYIKCEEPIEKLVTHLTSSVWYRGLVQLIKSNAHNIKTVGDLCGLSEFEINNLPIRTPKLSTVKLALQHLQYSPLTSATISEKGDDKSRLETVLEDDEEEERLPSADEALQQLADSQQNKDTENHDILKLSQNSDSGQLEKSTDKANQSQHSTIELNSDSLKDMSTPELFELHQKLTQFTNQVVVAIMNKSHSSKLS